MGLLWLQCYYGYSVTMVTVLLWLQCYYGYSVTMVTVLLWLQCYYGYSVTMVTVLLWLQCYYGYREVGLLPKVIGLQQGFIVISRLWKSALFSMQFFSIFAIVGFSKVSQVMRYSLFLKLLIFFTRYFLVFDYKIMGNGKNLFFWNNAQI